MLTTEDRSKALENPLWAAEYAHLCREHDEATGDRYLHVCLNPSLHSVSRGYRAREVKS